jgi:formate/nitrite transporter FocA (FNT family)
VIRVAGKRGGPQEGGGTDKAGATDELSEAFRRTVEEGERRLTRSWPELLATGAVGGLDLALGVLALLIVKHDTGSQTLASLAFTIGFVCLLLARSELFTENFLVPVAALAAGRARWPLLGRLWATTLAMNLLGGWVGMLLVMSGLPHLRPVATEIARHYLAQGLGWQSMAGAIIGGSVITLMTWMQHGTESVGGQVVAAVLASFLLAAGPLNHTIVISLEMLAGLTGHAPFGYLDWLGILAWTTLGNTVGGVGFVTVLRLVQVGEDDIKRERRRGGST